MWPALCTIQYRKEQLSTHGKKQKKPTKQTVGRGDVEMHGKEKKSEKKTERKMLKPKKVQ